MIIYWKNCIVYTFFMLLSAQVGGVLGQNAVENNYLTREELNAQVDAAVACRKGDKAACAEQKRLERPNKERDLRLLAGRTLFSTEYLFIVNGKGYVIQDHSVGHNFGDLNGIGNQHAHFNLKKLNLNTYTTNETIDIETWKAEQNIPHNRQTYGISPITGIPGHLYTKPSPHADPKEHFFERIFNMKNGNRGKTKK
ncbi:HNH/endonuclease VII fold putative polymorphic toxin [Neisseria lactamica]|nr:HNH/endonuclease VII fold putative polymorphic toxin [Neisseria lactamica]